ncbi:hypothetical protein CEXT_439081 [Caerostris extrusa]|uniref:Uncharacterized protein n=1 Tax=Caerostris extrusa TaxID=172846 RepID=A0AAV4NXB0_CAEEX|nr:hypothetical protein CEXT_439081 [Caerostris extrusa]
MLLKWIVAYESKDSRLVRESLLHPSSQSNSGNIDDHGYKQQALVPPWSGGSMPKLFASKSQIIAKMLPRSPVVKSPDANKNL